MNHSDPNQWHNPPQAASRRRLPGIALIATVIMVVLVLIGGGLYLWQGSSAQSQATGEPESMSELILERATSSSPEPTMDNSTEENSTEETIAESTTLTDTETVTIPAPEPESTRQEPMPAPEIRAAPRLGGGAAPVACDGRGVLIIESVVDDGTIDAHARISQLLTQNPGAVYYNPGICPSLRDQVNGHDIYPVVIDYGQNHDALCSAWRQLGGDPRYLNTDDEYTSPC